MKPRVKANTEISLTCVYTVINRAGIDNNQALCVCFQIHPITGLSVILSCYKQSGG